MDGIIPQTQEYHHIYGCDVYTWQVSDTIEQILWIIINCEIKNTQKLDRIENVKTN